MFVEQMRTLRRALKPPRHLLKTNLDDVFVRSLSFSESYGCFERRYGEELDAEALGLFQFSLAISARWRSTSLPQLGRPHKV